MDVKHHVYLLTYVSPPPPPPPSPTLIGHLATVDVKGEHGSAKWTQTSLICELGTWMYLNDLLPWKQSKMAAKHNYLKSLKLQSHCMQINFLFTVSTNVMLSSLLPRILWLLCFFFILLYHLQFMLTNNISNRHETF